jgi:hypothetical protein
MSVTVTTGESTALVYSKDTCWEFHQLLPATLVYGNILASLHEIDRKIHPDSKW